jgi:hypothetical protein
MTDVAKLQAGGKIAGIVPRDIEEVFRLATAVAKSGLAPRGMETAEKLTVAILHGLEIGLPPMMSIQKISIINGRPTVWGDAVPALILSRGFRLREWMSDDDATAFCEVTRPDGQATIRSFSVDDARKAGLWGKSGPWVQYPKRMLAMRARGFAVRDGAADALSGLYLAEEMQDAMIDVTPLPERKSSAASKRDGTADVLADIRSEIANAISTEMLEHVLENRVDDLATMPRKWAQLVQDDYEVRHDALQAAIASAA